MESGLVTPITRRISRLQLNDLQGTLPGDKITVSSITENQISTSANEGKNSLMQNLAERTHDQAGSFVAEGLDSFIGRVSEDSVPLLTTNCNHTKAEDYIMITIRNCNSMHFLGQNPKSIFILSVICLLHNTPCAFSEVKNGPVVKEKENVPLTGVFSDLWQHKETGDILGTEIIILGGFVKDGYQLFATVQFAEGVADVPQLVPVKLDGRKIKFKAEFFGKEIKFIGEISNKSLKGRLIEGKSNTDLFLPRGESFWQKPFEKRLKRK